MWCFCSFSEEVEECTTVLTGLCDEWKDGMCGYGESGEGLEAIGCRFAVISMLTVNEV